MGQESEDAFEEDERLMVAEPKEDYGYNNSKKNKGK